jgi:lysophospholipase L1-like esterase
MPSDKAKPPAANLWRAFDEAQFGTSNTLNLRESLPTVADARYRAEQWLRERQVSRAGKVLIITGRGNSSPDGVSPVREGVKALFPSLRRRGVVSEVKEHSPGAFVVTLAPISALLEAPRRKRNPEEHLIQNAPASLEGLEITTVDLLRRLAQRSLEQLGARTPEKFIEAEMLSKFSALAGGVRPGADGEQRLREAIIAALEQLDD